MKVYLKGQNIMEEEEDQRFCGKDTPAPLVSSNPRLVLVFNTTGVRAGRGFKAQYKFVTGKALVNDLALDTSTYY